MAKWLSFRVHIEGVTPLLQHRFGEAAEAALSDVKGTKKTQKQKRDPRKEAEAAAYRDADGFIVHPASAITGALREVGRNHKQTSSRRSLAYILPAGVRINSEFIPICDGTGKRAKDIEVDSRRVVNKTTKGAQLGVRARLEHWSSEFTLRINEDVIAVETVRQLLSEAGELIGIGAYRITSGGYFGTFQVVLFEAIEGSAVEQRKKVLTGSKSA